MKKIISVAIGCFSVIALSAQPGTVTVQVIDSQQQPLAKSSVELLKEADSSLIKIQLTDSAGTAQFEGLANGKYIFRISAVGYSKYITAFTISESSVNIQISAQMSFLPGTLENVTVSARKPFIEMHPDKTIINVEASITSVGATAMETLEKLPGITIDRDGNISLKGKPGVLILIDGKQIYLGSAELATMLGGMSASQINQIEIMDQPSSRYDASGNAGIINIKTKKNQQKGFNATITTSYGQGIYPKNNNNAAVNIRSGKINIFANYSLNANRNFTSLYALRTYFEPDEFTVKNYLEQPSYIKAWGQVHNIKTGVDYFVNPKTSLSVGFTGLQLSRSTRGNNPAIWMNAAKQIDSTISTESKANSKWRNGGVSFSFKHSFSSSKELSADVDVLGYRIRNTQFFENKLSGAGGYAEASQGIVPSDINILSAKTDYSTQLKAIKLETGWKSSRIHTDNLSDFEYRENGIWKEDLNRSNHFLYKENIHALYGNFQTTVNKWSFQGGLRYEMTHYDANQLGNAIQKDSAFSRNYNSLFPSAFISLAADSLHTFSFSVGRRIDRPAFQKLNPFLIIINKYTFQQGNPFFRPQYTWNFELTHSYKDVLVTSISYARINDYISQIFPIYDNGIVLYTEGNLPKMENIGGSVSVHLSPAKWWSLSGQAVVNYKKLEGTLWKKLNPAITEGSFSLNNQFRFSNNWSAELTGFYNTRGQTDIQEIVYPSGQLSIGVAKSILKNKATIKFAFRDLFYTQWMEGFTYFRQATEYFKMTRDTRAATLSFTFRFGKSYKNIKRSEGAAGEEIQRVGNG